MKIRTYELNCGWYIAKDENNIGMTSGWETSVRSDAVEAYVPSIIQQFFPEYHGVAFYWCRFTPELDEFDGGRMLLRFGGVDYKANVWLNGNYLGCEEGGETPFTFDVTEHIRNGSENLLAVRVLNTCEKTIDGLNIKNSPQRNKVVKRRAGSCLNHGGLWYGVSLQAVPSTRIEDVFAIADYNSGKVTLRLRLASQSKTEARLFVSIAEKSTDSATVAEGEWKINIESGSLEHEVSFGIKDFKPWHIDTPNLYIAKVTVITAKGEHTQSVRFGFRDFRVKDGYFYLNGKKLLIKSSHSGNAFPIGQMLPVDPDHLRRDFIYAKAAGFNMLRAIAGLFRPDQLELADEIGLLIYEECYASWCLGYSERQSWSNDAEYAKLAELHPDILLGDEKAMLWRWVNSTEKMILRDRNHPSVVTWGLLNETKSNSVYRTARDFLPRLRELDPTRFVILSSGRWDFDFNIGSASNPNSTVWEKTWGIDGHPEVFEKHVKEGKNIHQIAPDNHYYAPFPFQEKDKEIYRSYGNDFLPIFISEFGHGSVFNVIDEVRCFRQFGSRRDLEDYTWLDYQSKAFERDFKRLGLNNTFAFPEHILRESQKNNAMARREIFDVLRSNPRISGYSLTGLLDHGWCGEGLWSYWRNWKPEMFDTISDAWAPLRFCLFVSHNVYTDTPITVEAVLANDHALASGEYTARFAITSDGAPVYTFEERFTVDGDELAAPIMKRTLDVTLPEGDYELCAELDDGAARANKLPFSVKDRASVRADGCSVCCLGIQSNMKALMKDAGIEVTEFNAGNTPKTLLVCSDDTAEVAEAISAAERGSRVLFLDWSLFENESLMEKFRQVVPDATFWRSYDWLYHKELILNDRDVFDGLGRGLALGRDFTKEWPKYMLKTDTTPDYPICPAFETGSYMIDDSYYLVHAIAGYNFGEGKVYFNSFEIKSNIGSPVADRLLINIIKYLKD